jgi:biotin transporter BioY
MLNKLKELKQKPKKKVSNVMLVLICAMIILYTIAAFILQYFISIEISPTLTTAWYAFWGTELVCLTAIKTTKVKHEKNAPAVEADDEICNEEE